MATKQEIVAAVAKQCEVTKASAGRMLDALQEIFSDMLANGEDINLTGFLSIKSIHKPAHEARNPQTGAKVKVPAGYRIQIKAGKGLKDAVAKIK